MVDFLPSSWRRDWLPGFFLVAVTLAAYQPIWHAGFIWDDDAMLLNNALIHQAGGWYRMTSFPSLSPPFGWNGGCGAQTHWAIT